MTNVFQNSKWIGIYQSEPGWKQIHYCPFFGYTDSASGQVATPFGMIESNWEKDDSEIRVCLDLPGPVHANIDISGVQPRTVTGLTEFTVPNGEGNGA